MLYGCRRNQSSGSSRKTATVDDIEVDLRAALRERALEWIVE
jgi:hypothetical protein